MPKSNLTLGERAVNWAKVVGLIAGAFASGIGATWVRGEPDAELAYKRLRNEVNSLRIEIKEERSFVNGFLDGLKLQLIQSTKKEPVSSLPTKKVFQVSRKTCEPGYELKNGKCVPVKKSIYVSKTVSPIHLKKSKVTSSKSSTSAPPQVQQSLDHFIEQAVKRRDKKRGKDKYLPMTLQQLKKETIEE